MTRGDRGGFRSHGQNLPQPLLGKEGGKRTRASHAKHVQVRRTWGTRRRNPSILSIIAKRDLYASHRNIKFDDFKAYRGVARDAMTPRVGPLARARSLD